MSDAPPPPAPSDPPPPGGGGKPPVPPRGKPLKHAVGTQPTFMAHTTRPDVAAGTVGIGPATPPASAPPRALPKDFLEAPPPTLKERFVALMEVSIFGQALWRLLVGIVTTVVLVYAAATYG